MTVQRVYVANDTLLSSFSHLLPTIKTNLRVAGTQSSQSLVSGANLDFKLETRVHVVAIISLNDFNLSAPSVCTRRRLGTELEAWRGGGRERKSHSRGLIASLWHRHADGLEASQRGAWRHFARRVLEFLRSQFTDGASASPLPGWNTSIPPLSFHNAKQLTISAVVCFPHPLPDTCQF